MEFLDQFAVSVTNSPAGVRLDHGISAGVRAGRWDSLRWPGVRWRGRTPRPGSGRLVQVPGPRPSCSWACLSLTLSGPWFLWIEELSVFRPPLRDVGGSRWADVWTSVTHWHISCDGEVSPSLSPAWSPPWFAPRKELSERPGLQSVPPHWLMGVCDSGSCLHFDLCRLEVIITFLPQSCPRNQGGSCPAGMSPQPWLPVSPQTQQLLGAEAGRRRYIPSRLCGFAKLLLPFAP